MNILSLCITKCADCRANYVGVPSNTFDCTSTWMFNMQNLPQAIKHNTMTQRRGCSCHMSLCRGHTSACQHIWHAINVQDVSTTLGQKQVELGTRLVMFAVQSKRAHVGWSPAAPWYQRRWCKSGPSLDHNPGPALTHTHSCATVQPATSQPHACKSCKLPSCDVNLTLRSQLVAIVTASCSAMLVLCTHAPVFCLQSKGFCQSGTKADWRSLPHIQRWQI